jgi:hypothetical protein
MPVVTLFRRASALAEAALCTRRTEDLELAFAGEARGAFLCLQCILTEEEEWCKGTGCPGTKINSPSRLSLKTNLEHSMRCEYNSVNRIAHPPHHRRFPPLHGFCRITRWYAYG